MEEYIMKERSRQLSLIFVVVMSVFIFSIDYSMLNISLPTIASYFRVNIGTVARLPMVYILIVTSCLLGFGKLGDTKSYKKIFVAGFLCFLCGTIMASVAATMNTLLAARVVQALGESMFSPVGLALLTTFLPANSRGKALGLIAMTQGVGLAIGNIAGGYINAHYSWHSIFLVNIPILLIGTVLALKILPDKQPKSQDGKFDLIGTALIFVALATMVFILSALGKKELQAFQMLRLTIISVTAFTLFILQETRVQCPLLDLKLFKNLNFGYANIAAFFMIFVFMGFIFLAPFYLQFVRGFPVMKVGIFLMIPALIMPLFALISGQLSDRIGSRLLCVLGALLSMLAFAAFAMLTKDSSIMLLAGSLFTLGAGAGLFLAPNNKLVMAHAPEDKQGVASGVYKIGLSVGSVFGIAIFPIIIMQGIMKRLGATHPGVDAIKQNPALMSSGFSVAFVFGIFVCAAALLASILAKDRK